MLHRFAISALLVLALGPVASAQDAEPTIQRRWRLVWF